MRSYTFVYINTQMYFFFSLLCCGAPGGAHTPPGLYCSGWLKTGPIGVIAITINNSFDTAHSVVEDVTSPLAAWT